MTRKELNDARKKKLAESLKVGAFVKNVWGATMRRVNYWEIIAIDKTRVTLRSASIDGDPSPNCAHSEVTLLGSNPQSTNLVYATTRMGYLLKEGESLKDYWSTYEFINVGDKTSCWSD